MSIPLKFRLSSEQDTDYDVSKTATGNAELYVQCPENTGRQLRTQNINIVTESDISRTIPVTQRGAATFTQWQSEQFTAESNDTYAYLYGFSNSSTLSFATASNSDFQPEITEVKWTELDDTGGSTMPPSMAATGIGGDPGLTRRYKFRVKLVFSMYNKPLARTVNVQVTDSDHNKAVTTLTQTGIPLYLTIYQDDLELDALPGNITIQSLTNGTLRPVATTGFLEHTQTTLSENGVYETQLSWSSNTSGSTRYGTATFAVEEDTQNLLTVTINATQDSVEGFLSVVEPINLGRMPDVGWIQVFTVYTNGTLEVANAERFPFVDITQVDDDTYSVTVAGAALDFDVDGEYLYYVSFHIPEWGGMTKSVPYIQGRDDSTFRIDSTSGLSTIPVNGSLTLYAHTAGSNAPLSGVTWAPRQDSMAYLITQEQGNYCEVTGRYPAIAYMTAEIASPWRTATFPITISESAAVYQYTILVIPYLTSPGTLYYTHDNTTYAVHLTAGAQGTARRITFNSSSSSVHVTLEGSETIRLSADSVDLTSASPTASVTINQINPV